MQEQGIGNVSSGASTASGNGGATTLCQVEQVEIPMADLSGLCTVRVCIRFVCGACMHTVCLCEVLVYDLSRILGRLVSIPARLADKHTWSVSMRLTSHFWMTHITVQVFITIHLFLM